MVMESWEDGQYKEIWVYAKETESDDQTMDFMMNCPHL